MKKLSALLVLSAFIGVLSSCGAATTQSKLESYEDLNIVVKAFFVKCEKRGEIRDLNACKEIPASDQRHTDCVANVKGEYAELGEHKHMPWLNEQGCPIKLNTSGL